jgi:UDP-3-O-[3-hydroxymyristoyl] glucosamine N-acyltransferase
MDGAKFETLQLFLCTIHHPLAPAFTRCYNISMSHTVQEVADFSASQLIGDGAVEVSKVASLDHAKPGDLVFVQSAKDLDKALSTAASAVIAGDFASSASSEKPLLISDNPRLAFCQAGALLHPARTFKPGIHPTAVVDPSAKVAATAAIDAHAVVEAKAVIGERTHIGANCSVAEGVVIGDDCDLYPNVVIYQGTTLGRRVIVHAGSVLGSDGFGYVRDETYLRYHKFPQVGELIIGDYVEIGANVTIDRGALDKTVIGPGTKLDNLVHIGHNDIVGANVVIAAQTGISGSSDIGDGCVIGGQVGIGDHVRIEAGSIVGSQGGVFSNKILRGKGEVYWGTPARPLHQYLKETAFLSRLARKDRSAKS